jgi:hypothetical protein
VRRQGIAIFWACAGYGVIVGPVSFPLLEPALRIPAVRSPKRSPALICLPSAQYPAVWAAHFSGPGPIGPARGGLLRNVGVTEYSETRGRSTIQSPGAARLAPCHANRTLL